jgi:L-serine dehydratase
MKKYGVFDILGPIMIGPSSSHTAGAVRLGLMARAIATPNFNRVECLLHGSFGSTYKGHGTDRALAAGLLGMKPSDIRLKDSLKLAQTRGLNITFIETDLGDTHPNTVKFIIYKNSGDVISIVGSSIGGGNIVISEIDGEKLEFTGKYPTIIIKHLDYKGVISKATYILYKEDINIAYLKVYRDDRGKSAYMIFETDSRIKKETIERLQGIDKVISVKVINELAEDD